MHLLGKAIKIAASAHKKQIDKKGRPYILHPLWVMNSLSDYGDDYMIVAVLHDVIEDTPWTARGLEMAGFPDHIVEALKLLDMRGKDYMESIAEIQKNDLARIVKMRDLKHNSSQERMLEDNKKNRARLEKYSKAYQYLVNRPR